MKLTIKILISVIGLYSINAIAGTLSGEWYLETSARDKREAFTIATSESTNQTTQATLGLRRIGLSNTNELYIIATSTKQANNCQYQIASAKIDANSFLLKGTSRNSQISDIKAKTSTQQSEFWRLLRKGKTFAVTLSQDCKNDPQSRNQTTTFRFSLKGSSAAYKFVADQKSIATLEKTPDETQQITSQNNDEKSEIKTSESLTKPLIAIIFIILIIVLFAITHTKRTTNKSTNKKNKVRFEPTIDNDEVLSKTVTVTKHRSQG